MALSQLLLPSLTVVLKSESGSTVLRDYQHAQSREIQIPLFGPRDDCLMETIDTRTPTGYIVYKCEYPHEQDTATLFEEKLDTKRSFWIRLVYEDSFNVTTTYFSCFQRRLKMFCKIKGLGRK